MIYDLRFTIADFKKISVKSKEPNRAESKERKCSGPSRRSPLHPHRGGDDVSDPRAKLFRERPACPDLP
jgi:hypothetical protein